MRVIACATLAPAHVRRLTLLRADAPSRKLVTPPSCRSHWVIAGFPALIITSCDVEQKYRERSIARQSTAINLYDVGIAYNFTSRFRMTVTLLWKVMGRSQVVRTPAARILDRFHHRDRGLRDLALDHR